MPTGEPNDTSMTVDENSVLIDPDFHDGRVTSVTLVDGSLTLAGTDYAGKRWSLTLPSVLSVSMKDFLVGNIIFEIQLVQAREWAFDIATYFDTSFFDDDLRDVNAAVAEGRLLAMHVIPTYGAELVALSTARLTDITFEPASSS
jgi:hypothetical protein